MARYYKGNNLCGPTQHICTTKSSSPGPKYGLPTLTGYEGHDPAAHKLRAPAYSLRKRVKNGQKYASPGPAAYLPAANQTRLGGDCNPGYSLADRHKDNTKHIGPGPGAYAPEKYLFPKSRTAPEYTMGRRLKALRQDDAYKPAPNAYALPSGIGSANPDLKKSPAYFLTFRNQKGNFARDYAQTPGPAAYPAAEQSRVKTSAPEYSIGVRCHLPGDKTTKPGPAAHSHELCPHTAYSTKKGAPAFSFGRRHNEYAVTPVFADCD